MGHGVQELALSRSLSILMVRDGKRTLAWTDTPYDAEKSRSTPDARSRKDHSESDGMPANPIHCNIWRKKITQ
jgi:hypothetical protein